MIAVGKPSVYDDKRHNRRTTPKLSAAHFVNSIHYSKSHQTSFREVYDGMGGLMVAQPKWAYVVRLCPHLLVGDNPPAAVATTADANRHLVTMPSIHHW